MPDNDQELIEGYSQGDPKAFENLYQRYKKRVYVRALGMVRDEEQALDIVQECFIRVSRSVLKLRKRKGFVPWLMRIVTNLCLDYLRKKSRVEVASLGHPGGNPTEGLCCQIGDNSLDPAQILEKTELKEKLWKAISSLPPEYGEVFILKYVVGLSGKETAQIMNCPEGTVRWRLYQAKRILREKMGEEGERLREDKSLLKSNL